MLLYDPEQTSLHVMETKKLSVNWYVYTHESRMLLLASGMQCTIFSGYQVIHIHLSFSNFLLLRSLYLLLQLFNFSLFLFVVSVLSSSRHSSSAKI